MEIYEELTRMNLRNSDPYYSLSRLHCFSRCPRQYYYRYVEQRPEPLKYSLLSGAALHKGLEVHNQRRFKEGKKSGLKEILEVAREFVRYHYHEGEHEGEELPEADCVDRLVKEGKPPTDKYCKEVEQEAVGSQIVEAIEAEMKWEFEGEPFLGYADLVLSGVVIDYKFLSRRHNKDALIYSPQLNLYVVHYQRPAAYIQLLRGKDFASFEVAETTEESQRLTLDWVRDTIKAIKVAKQTGHFPRREAASWECKSCVFRDRCFKGSVIVRR